MATKVIMPQLGESVVEGTISKWLKGKGEKINELEPLLEVNTDKVDTEIPSPASGTVLKIEIPEGTTVQAGTVLAWIGSPEESLPGENGGSAPESAQREKIPAEALHEKTIAATAGPETPPAGQTHDIGFISPVVAKIASEYKVNLSDIQGTGQGGRITKKDVLAYIEKQQAAPAEARPMPAATPSVAPSQPAPKPQAVLPFSDDEIQPLTQVRRSIAEHMVLSKHTSPHVTTVMEVDLSRIVAHRDANKASFARDGANLTFTPYFVSAAVSALKEFPLVNSSWSEDGIRLHHHINIGIATSLGEEGLIVPVIKNADGLSLLGIARAVNDLAGRARAHKLQAEEVKAGTFTITNHGITGSLFANPIINQPQCAILGVGMIQKRVVVLSDGVSDSIAIRPMVYLSLTFDHRILDGASADNFLHKVVELLQDWGS